MRIAGSGGTRATAAGSLALVPLALGAGTGPGADEAGRTAVTFEQLIVAAPARACATFWNRTLPSWQSELVAVGSMVALSISLRQRGSPESKPVGSPHTATGVEG